MWASLTFRDGRMSSVSKAEERRRKILARQKDRLAFATGVVETLNTPNTTEGDGESVRKEEGEAAALREEATLNRSMEVEESLLESKEVVGVASDVGTGEVSSFEDLMSMARMSGPMPNFGGVGTDDSPADLNVLMNMMGPLQSMLPVESTETEASRRITAVSNIPTVPTWLRRLLLVVIAICIVFAKDVFKTVGTVRDECFASESK